MRLNQYIASCGVCSRREADRLVEAGQVLVDGVPAQPGMRLQGTETVTVRGKKLQSPAAPVVVAWYKPAGVTCTARDPHAGKTISDVFRYPVRLTYAGRLDRDSEGLLLMTNDGPLIDAMMRAANGHEKEYYVRVRSRISDGDLHRLASGMYLKEIGRKTKPCTVKRLGDRTFSIVLTEGMNRQIRRMCAVLGHEIRFLKRVRVLNVELGAMKPGQQRRITGKELEQLYSLAFPS
jgi:23S rRNA pseudouridine2604 synthase